jgi:hypothetical protein
MEVHARIINAGLDKDESQLPPGYRFYSSIPKAPPNCSWRWDIETQLWASFDKGGAKCSDLTDGLKYAVGITHLPTGESFRPSVPQGCRFPGRNALSL